MLSENATEQELAGYFQAHKNDEDEWEEAPPPRFARKRKSRDLSMKITVRFTPSESDLLRAEAMRLNLPYSEVVRRAVQHLVRPAPLSAEAKTT